MLSEGRRGNSSAPLFYPGFQDIKGGIVEWTAKNCIFWDI